MYNHEFSEFLVQDRIKVSKGAKIRNRYNQAPHLTQDNNWKVTNSQLDTTNESQEASPFPAGDHKAHINRRAQRHCKHKTEQKHKRSTKEASPWNGQWNILLEGINRFNGAPTSPLIQKWIKTHRYLVCMKDPYLFDRSFDCTFHRSIVSCPRMLEIHIVV